jgi:GNAT superfamily N-acetyltransferase
VNHALLREIAGRAKGHWGYDADLVATWAAAIPFPPEEEIFVAERDGAIVGWASLVVRGDVAILDDLWVEPQAMGRGVGRELFLRVAGAARRRGAVRLEWEAEPNALGFYERMGGRYLRDGDESEWGRTLPVLGVEL